MLISPESLAIVGGAIALAGGLAGSSIGTQECDSPGVAADDSDLLRPHNTDTCSDDSTHQTRYHDRWRRHGSGGTGHRYHNRRC